MQEEFLRRLHPWPAIVYASGTAPYTLKDRVDSSTTKITQTTKAKYAPTVSVGLAEEDLPTGDVNAANGAWLYLKNVDTTNFVKYGPKSGGAMIEFGRLYPGKEAWLFLAPAVVLRWIADTAAVLVDVKMFEK